MMKIEVTGGAVDLSDLSLSSRQIQLVQEAAGPDCELLLENIRARIGRYRLLRDGRESTPQDAETVEHLKKLRAHALELRRELAILPSVASEWAYETGTEIWGRDVIQESDLELARLAALLGAVTEKYAPYIGRRGEKPKDLEHSLLSDVAEMIEPFIASKVAVAVLAAEILRSSGVHGMPSYGKNARAIVLKWRKQKGL